MLNVCELYAYRHNLCFSTDPDPNKSKTKCIAFLQKKRNIRNLNLCGNPLPWVNSGKHLGTTIENPFRSILSQDMKDKRAQYIHRNNELMQEFAYADSVKQKPKSTQLTTVTFMVLCFGTGLGSMLNAYIKHGTHLSEKCSD